MAPTASPPTAVARRAGAGLVVGALALFVLSAGVTPELAALVVLAAGLATYALERARGTVVGLSAGLALSGVIVVLDRQVDPVGATVGRSTAVAAAIGLAVALAAVFLDRFGGPGGGDGAGGR